MVFWSFSCARLTSGRLNFILPHLRPFSWFCSFLLILFFHLHVASPSFTSSASVAQIFFPPFLLSLCLSVVPCCLPSSAQCDVSSCFAFYLELSALVSVLWGGVSVLSQPQLFDCMASLNLMFFGFLAVGSSCCHFFSRTKAILFGE